VEITQKGLRHVQINRKAGIDFALVMRAFLRADPDIIMVGESRDKETVSMGVEASLTGHLVFSTLHTNSSPESIVRLLDMGMDPFNFADALLGILAQRLARKLCQCKQEYTPDADEFKLFVTECAEELRHSSAWKADYAGEAKRLYENWINVYGHQGRLRFYKALGCDKCNQTGYKGRLGLQELLVADEQIKRLIQETRAGGRLVRRGSGNVHARPENGRDENSCWGSPIEAGAIRVPQVAEKMSPAS
jgi:type II secretory ATPase GspE/PulE/Tfp pilus assembly ATPase PilB-like protein